MNKLQERIISKFNKSEATGISLRLRLFLFLLVLVLTMLAGIIVILLVSGTFSAGLSESKKLIRNELLKTAQDISEEYGKLSVQTVEFSKELTLKIEENLTEQNIPFSELANHPDRIEKLVLDLYERTYYSLQKSHSSGAFLILDTTVNTSLENADYSKAGLYIKNMEPNIVSASTPSLTLLRGFSAIGRINSINLHTQWSMEFDISDAEYYTKPIETAKNNRNLPISKLYYWSKPLIFPNTSEEVMLCTVPLIGTKGEVYGICGFDISSMLFKLSYMPNNEIFTRMFCVLSPHEDNIFSIHRSMIAGGYPIKDLSKDALRLWHKDRRNSFSSYGYEDNELYFGYHISTQLYAKGSPYFNDAWVTAVLVPKEDIISSITKLNIILACLLCILMTIGIVISIIFSNRYLQPLSKGIEIIKSTTVGDAPRTNVQEVDDLINYLASYKQELNQRVEKDRHQLQVLEQFVERTKLLTPAERSVFNLSIQGLSPKEIADQMFLSINTIKTHNKRIFVKLGISSREELLLYINMLKELGHELK